MTVAQFLLYLASGRLLTWLLQTNGLTRRLWRTHPLLTELSGCDLCLGFWMYLALALLLGPGDVFGLWRRGERVVLAAGSTFLAHLVRLGWQSKFGVTVIE